MFAIWPNNRIHKHLFSGFFGWVKGGGSTYPSLPNDHEFCPILFSQVLLRIGTTIRQQPVSNYAFMQSYLKKSQKSLKWNSRIHETTQYLEIWRKLIMMIFFKQLGIPPPPQKKKIIIFSISAFTIYRFRIKRRTLRFRFVRVFEEKYDS